MEEEKRTGTLSGATKNASKCNGAKSACGDGWKERMRLKHDDVKEQQ